MLLIFTLFIYLFFFFLILCGAPIFQALLKDKTLAIGLLLSICNDEFWCTLSFSLSKLKAWSSWNIRYISFYVEHIFFLYGHFRSTEVVSIQFLAPQIVYTSINPFVINVSFPYLQGFPMVSRGRERVHWKRMN